MICYMTKARELDCIYRFCKECNALAISAMKTDKEIQEKCRQYFHTVRKEIQETRTILDERITSEVSSLREDINKLKKYMEKNSDPKLREEIENLKKGTKEHEQNLKERIDEKINDATTICRRAIYIPRCMYV